MNSLKLTNKIRYNFANFHQETSIHICRPSPPPGAVAGTGGKQMTPWGGVDNDLKNKYLDENILKNK